MSSLAKHTIKKPALLTAILLLATTAALITGCSNALPREEDNVRSRWNSFEEAMADYEKIEPYVTTKGELQDLGFDPYTQPNIHILSYLDVIQRFMPNQSIKLDDLDDAVSFCIRSRGKCIAYEAQPQKTKSKRVGNVALDMMTFKRRTLRTGWSFYALIVINDGVVVYKVWSGEPILGGEKIRKNPLGPLQGLDSGAIRQVL
ncbi:MAG: hypothetical protein KUG71_11745 [Porticoccaceae bacterium]|nr:hypothetical protein [Porticoccaceae bacterium]